MEFFVPFGVQASVTTSPVAPLPPLNSVPGGSGIFASNLGSPGGLNGRHCPGTDVAVGSGVAVAVGVLVGCVAGVAVADVVLLDVVLPGVVLLVVMLSVVVLVPAPVVLVMPHAASAKVAAI